MCESFNDPVIGEMDLVLGNIVNIRNTDPHIFHCQVHTGYITENTIRALDYTDIVYFCCLEVAMKS